MQRIRFLADIASALILDVQAIVAKEDSSTPMSLSVEAKNSSAGQEKEIESVGIDVEQAAASVFAAWFPLTTTVPTLPEALHPIATESKRCLIC